MTDWNYISYENNNKYKMSSVRLLHDETGAIYELTFNFWPWMATSSLLGLTIATFMDIYSQNKATLDYRKYCSRLGLLSVGMYITIGLTNFKVTKCS